VNVHEQSRVIVVRLDEEAMTATLVREYTHPDGVLAATQGNAQVLVNGNVFVGWGSEPFLSEFDHDGEILFDARFPEEGESYRVFRSEWEGRPQDEPVLSAAGGSEERVTAYVSWNGATEVAEWEVLAGPQADRLQPVGSVKRKGFETEIAVKTSERYLGVRAKNAQGEPVSIIRAIEVPRR